ncbi:efflux RND transporter periplasmic adaptor subunit [Aliagarivorans marinus]|uniref:efflux RND transporter periplasmic adaptor subunit n=1 Tax=Aliagarivorans marinus TaxID=561965 RepID=UPI0004090215|nr:efflux RND transporter periplasmic adaptor subunit [Aliagarivorans marinus]
MAVDRVHLSVLATALLALAGCENSVEVVEKTPRPVQVLTISQNNLALSRSFSGIVESQKQASLAFRVPGTLTEVLVSMGDHVEQGQLLARLDPHDYQVTLAELNARLSEAESSKRLAKIELDRVTQANQADAVAEVNLDRARSGYERASAAVEVVKRNIQKSEDALTYTELRAPFAGVIAHQGIENHEQVAPGIAVFELHQPERLQVEIDVPENLITAFSAGMHAQVNQSRSSSSDQAEVSEVASRPNRLKRSFPVKLQLHSNNLALVPGQAVDISLELPQQSQQYCLPYSAISSQHDQQVIYIAERNQAVPVPVEKLEMRAKQACVEAQLAPGQQVIVAGVDYLKPYSELGPLLETEL